MLLACALCVPPVEHPAPAWATTPRNLLQRKGYASLEDLRARAYEEARQKGLAMGYRDSILGLCELLDLPVSPARHAQLQRMDAAALQALLAQIRSERRWPARSKAGPAKPSRSRSGSR